VARRFVRLLTGVLTLCSVTLLPAATLLAANAPMADVPRATPQQIAVLVDQLGSAEFAEREQASRDLVAIGISTRAALEQAVQSPDAEVRLRARAILVTVLSSDFEQRLEAFALGDEKSHLTLPAWEEFAAVYGDHRAARQLFVEMQRCEPELLEAVAAGPTQATTLLNDRMREIIDGRRDSLNNLGTLATLLFVGAADGVEAGEDGCLHVYPYVVQATYRGNLKSPMWPGLLKKMVGRWIARDTTPAMTNQNLQLAAQLELKPETMSIASRVLETKDSLPGSKQLSIMMIARFGDQGELPLVEKYLQDTTVLGQVQVDDPPRQVDLQMRDVALAAALHMSGQSLREYGFNNVQEYAPTVYQVGTLGLEDEESRIAAFKKWTEWRAEHSD